MYTQEIRPAPNNEQGSYATPFVARVAGGLAISVKHTPTTGNIDNSYDALFADEATYGSTVSNDTEYAAVRRPDFYQALDGVPKDSAGTLRPDEEQARIVVAALTKFEGLSAEREKKDEDDTVQQGIERAKGLAANGQAADYLQSLPFLRDSSTHRLTLQARKTNIVFKGYTLTVAAERIVGASGFDSWQGRGYNGSAEVADRQSDSGRRSFDQIIDYATRDTQLPPLEDSKLFLTDSGAFLYAGNAHRAAAAKLRGEAVRVSFPQIVDLRGQQLDTAQQQTVAGMYDSVQAAVEER